MDAIATKPVLKVSVLATGAILLDGHGIELDRLAQALQDAKRNDGAVYYYREAATGNPPPLQAMSVLNLVIQNKLPISLSSQPDFSDYVDAKGVSHPRSGQPASAAKESRSEAIEKVFADARRMAAGEKGPRGLVLVTPDFQYLLLPTPAPSPQLDAQAAGLEQMISSTIKRKIAVIANTRMSAPPNIAEVAKSIPFLGNLMGLCYLGHAVCLFSGDARELEAGCREADLLIVDSAVLPSLPTGWEDDAAKVMRNANLILQDRASFQLRILRSAGQSRDRLEFPA
jgi:hypothetical protein